MVQLRPMAERELVVPQTLTAARHGQSRYYALKDNSLSYQEFKKAFAKMREDPITARELARELHASGNFRIVEGDRGIELTELGMRQARAMGSSLRDKIEVPEIIIVSPYRRAVQSLESMIAGWPELGEVEVIEDERLRELDYGEVVEWGDWSIYLALHPEEAERFAEEGPYNYRFNGGENIPDVRERVESLYKDRILGYSGNMLLAAHHNSILSLRADIEGLNPEEYVRIDNESDVFCGITIFRGDPTQNKLVLKTYNEKIYQLD